jgi:hypothetical protein
VATAADGCVRPVRLRGTTRDLDPATGEILRTLGTGTPPDKVMYTRAGTPAPLSVPPCAETYRRDTYQLIRAGLTGGKGIPATARAHPLCSPPSPPLASARSPPSQLPQLDGRSRRGRFDLPLRTSASRSSHGSAEHSREVPVLARTRSLPSRAGLPRGRFFITQPRAWENIG